MATEWLVVWLASGLVLGAGFIGFAVRGSTRRESRVIAVGLAVAASPYVVFSLAGGAGPAALELLGMAVFTATAYAGFRWWPLLLAVGWTGHVAWDVGLHLLGPGYGPAWYATLCVTFDLLVAGWVVYRARALVDGRNGKVRAGHER